MKAENNKHMAIKTSHYSKQCNSALQFTVYAKIIVGSVSHLCDAILETLNLYVYEA